MVLLVNIRIESPFLLATAPVTFENVQEACRRNAFSRSCPSNTIHGLP